MKANLNNYMEDWFTMVKDEVNWTFDETIVIVVKLPIL